MVFLAPEGRGGLVARFVRPFGAPNIADLVALLLIGSAAVLVVHGAQMANRPLAELAGHPVVLDVARLPGYALLTTLRMFAAILASLLFTFVIGTLAAKSQKAASIIVPALDILQSVPVLGFLTFTVAFFLGLFPGSELGAECASVFAVFTAQAWNMAFSFYQSLRTIPRELDEASRQFGQSPWRRFLRLELPFATPSLIWNTMMSMSGGWFFVVASEAIAVGDKTVTLPGIGSWLAVAIERKDLGAVAWAVVAMAVVIAVYDQLIFRPIVAWADKFRVEQTASGDAPRSWLYDLARRTRLMRRLMAPLSWAARALLRFEPPRRRRRPAATPSVWLDRLWTPMVVVLLLLVGWRALAVLAKTLALADVGEALGLGAMTFVRVAVLIVLASLVWVPVGVWIGLRPRWAERAQPLAQFLAAFPANVLFPVAVLGIVAFHLNPDIWLSPLMVFGTQWYIAFNVIAGASALPNELKEAAQVFGVRSWQWWRTVALPGVFPYFITGALTAAGGSWNASIVAEAVSWGTTHLEAHGLGAFIAKATAAGDLPRVALGVAVMSLFVIVLNRVLWRPLYGFAERRLRLD